MNELRYSVRSRIGGWVIAEFKTAYEAEKALKRFEELDKGMGVYEENFYEIYDQQSGVIIHE